jgi:hypothetical protein
VLDDVEICVVECSRPRAEYRAVGRGSGTRAKSSQCRRREGGILDFAVRRREVSSPGPITSALDVLLDQTRAVTRVSTVRVLYAKAGDEVAEGVGRNVEGEEPELRVSGTVAASQ